MIGNLYFNVDWEFDPDLDRDFEFYQDNKEELDSIRAGFCDEVSKAFRIYLSTTDANTFNFSYDVYCEPNSPDDMGMVIDFDENAMSEEDVKKLLLGFRPFLKTTDYWEYMTTYGSMIYGGSRYEPPEYEDIEYKVTVYVYYIDDDVEFESTN